MITTTLEWHRTAEKPPESFETVIAADGDGNTFAGYTNGEYWRDDCGDMVLAPEFWAHLPAGPVPEPVAETCKPDLQVEGAEAVTWKLVPVEPTTEMCRAVCDCHDIDHQEQIQDDYRAMLAAAPPARLAEPEAAPELLEALRDMYAGWQYIRSFHGDLYGVGWDRCDEKARAAIAKAEGGNDE